MVLWAEGVFKAIRLGRAIMAAQQQAKKTLETRIRARSILRTPIVVDLSDLALLNFYRNPLRSDSLPAIKRFSQEIDEYLQNPVGGCSAT